MLIVADRDHAGFIPRDGGDERRLCPDQQICRWTIHRAQNVPFWGTPSTRCHHRGMSGCSRRSPLDLYSWTPRGGSGAGPLARRGTATLVMANCASRPAKVPRSRPPWRRIAYSTHPHSALSSDRSEGRASRATSRTRSAMTELRSGRSEGDLMRLSGWNPGRWPSLRGPS
jgi:hypothetical protein